MSAAIRLGAGVSLLMAMGGHAALAQNFTIVNGQTVNTTQTMANAGDTGVVDDGGNISPVPGDGVQMNNANQTLTNNGVINASTLNSDGVVVTGVNATIVNNATLVGTGGNSNGIVVFADGANITNNGVLLTAAGSGSGIAISVGNNVVVLNAGTLTTTGNPGVFGGGGSSNVMVTNTGTINTTQNGGFGIRLQGPGATIVNSGTITTSGGNAIGIVSEGANAMISNSGTITTQGATAHGIWSFGTNGQVTNSGRIFTPNANAIEFNGAQNNVLNLLPGTVIQGGLVLGGGTDTLNVGNGLSINYTFDRAPDVLNTNGTPTVVIGTKVTTLDTTGLAAIPQSNLAIVNGAFGAVTQQLSQTNSGSALGYAEDKGDGFPAGNDWRGAGPTNAAWAKAIGGFQAFSPAGTAINAHQFFGGGVAGLDTLLGDDTRLGIFGGVALGKTSVSGNTTDIGTTTGLVGVYGSHGDWLEFALSGGISRNVSDRQVLNNLVVGGIETAHAEYNSLFVSPEITVKAGGFDAGGIKVRPSARVRYTYQHLDGYMETGSSANLTVGARNTHTIDGRLQLAFGFVETADTNFELRLGVDGQITSGANAVNATLLGQALNFDPGGNTGTIGGFVGAHLTQAISDTASLFATAEIGTGTGTPIRISAEAGVRMRF